MEKYFSLFLLIIILGACQQEDVVNPLVTEKPLEKIEGPKFNLGKAVQVTNDIVTTEFDFPRNKTWKGAQIACDSLNKEKILGINDWRVPTIEELKILYEASKEKIISNFLYEESMKFWVYWSITLPPGPDSLYWAQVVDFKNGPKKEFITVAYQEEKYNFRPVSSKKMYKK